VKRLRLTPEAELDLDEAYSWYEAQAPEFAADFLAPSIRASRRSVAILRRISWSTPRCDEHSFGAFPTRCSMSLGGHFKTVQPGSELHASADRALAMLAPRPLSVTVR